MLKIDVNKRDVQRIQKTLLALGNIDIKDFHEEAAGYMEESIKTNLDSESTPEGKKWPPLSRRYARRKAKKYPGKPMLEATGQMKSQLTHTSDTVSGKVFFKGGGNPDRRLVALWHQTSSGSYAGKRKSRMPQRRFWGFSRTRGDFEKIHAILNVKIDQAMTT